MSDRGGPQGQRLLAKLLARFREVFVLATVPLVSCAEVKAIFSVIESSTATKGLGSVRVLYLRTFRVSRQVCILSGKTALNLKRALKIVKQLSHHLVDLFRQFPIAPEDQILYFEISVSFIGVIIFCLCFVCFIEVSAN